MPRFTQEEIERRMKLTDEASAALVSLWAHTDFSAGFCGGAIRYELKFSRMPTSKEVNIVINKLRVDADRMKAEEAQLPPTLEPKP